MSFESIHDYIVGNFSHIQDKLNDNKKQDKYYQKWMQKYSKIFNTDDDLKIIDWKIREWRAIKEIYASAIIHMESELALNNGCITSYYFLLYYSLFHAMLSSICFDTNITLKQIADINHSKVGNQFKNTYCNGKNSILSEDIYTLFKSFKYLREYYTYTPPLNMTFYDNSYLQKLEDSIIKCFQITNLHSLILERSFHKNSKIYLIDTEEKLHHLMESFNILISKPSIHNPNKYILDPSDINARDEIIQYGIGFEFISLQLDHTYDEFRTYMRVNESFEYKNRIQSDDIYSFIFKSIM